MTLGSAAVALVVIGPFKAVAKCATTGALSPTFAEHAPEVIPAMERCLRARDTFVALMRDEIGNGSACDGSTQAAFSAWLQEFRVQAEPFKALSGILLSDPVTSADAKLQQAVTNHWNQLVGIDPAMAIVRHRQHITRLRSELAKAISTEQAKWDDDKSGP
jgi:hypothetical protein